MSNCKNVFKEIICCENVDKIYAGEKNNPCERIVNYQMSKGVQLNDFKGPEVWNGSIDTSQVLVISSNPGIGDKEVIPTRTWDIRTTCDFYQNRFTSSKAWVNSKLGSLQIGDVYSSHISNWVQTRKNIDFLFNGNIEFGVDCTLLELVHCKSPGEQYGVRQAINECTKRYFEKIMEISPAKVLIITGRFAIDFICSKYVIKLNTLNNGYGLYGPIKIFGIDRVLIFLPHTNYRGKRKAQFYIDEDQKIRINKFLAQFKNPDKHCNCDDMER